MRADAFDLLCQLYDVERQGLKWRMACPVCDGGVVTVAQLDADTFECTCSKGCGEGPIRRAASDRLDAQRQQNGVTSYSVGRVVNGASPTSTASPRHEETSKTGENGGFVVQVVRSLAMQSSADLILEKEALYGLPGDVVRAIEPHTESHSAAILASFIVGAGVLLGRGPHVYRDGARHGSNEFACLVGLTAKGRKGTATRRVDEVFLHSNSSEWTTGVMHASGLGSGEALIEALADDGPAPPAGRRCYVFEEEFSRPLKVMRREGSTLSENLRAAWDGGVLSNRTKGKRLEARQTHVGLLGHITEQELRLQLASAEVFNGFGNRFLWFCTTRSKSLPFGGGDAPIAPVVATFHETLKYTWTLGRVEFDEEARRMWGKGGVYKLLTNRPPGLLGAITSRAEAHVTRLALLYALLDADREIRPAHLLAALAVWDYSEKSCAYLFGVSTGDEYADTLQELLDDVYPGGLTRTEIRDRFGRNAPPGRIPKALTLLEEKGCAVKTTVRSGAGGRPTEYWQSAFEARQNDLNDITPLQRARELVRRHD